MPEAIFRGIVKAGRFHADDLVRHGGWLAKAEGKRVIASLKRETAGRTMSQNKYYWGVVLATLSEWSGHEPEELHEHLKRQFLGLESRELPSGEQITVPPSTKTLTVQAFVRYVDQVVKWAAENGVYVPSSEELIR